MTIEGIVDFGHGYRLVPFDARNWKLQHLHEARSTNPKLNGGGEKWRDTGNYFQTAGTAAAFVWRQRVRDELDRAMDLKEFGEFEERIAEELMESVRKGLEHD